MSLGEFCKSPVERKRYSIDYIDWLDKGEAVTAASFSVAPQGELEVDATSVDPDGSRVVFFVSGGVSGSSYIATVRAETGGGQVREDTIEFTVR